MDAEVIRVHARWYFYDPVGMQEQRECSRSLYIKVLQTQYVYMRESVPRNDVCGKHKVSIDSFPPDSHSFRHTSNALGTPAHKSVRSCVQCEACKKIRMVLGPQA